MTVAEGLTRALLRAGIPVVSVSVKSDDDRTTWAIQYADAATDQQQASGEALRLSYSLAADTSAADEDAAARLDDRRLKAIVIWVAGKLSIAPATARAEIVAIYKGLPG